MVSHVSNGSLEATMYPPKKFLSQKSIRMESKVGEAYKSANNSKLWLGYSMLHRVAPFLLKLEIYRDAALNSYCM